MKVMEKNPTKSIFKKLLFWLVGIILVGLIIFVVLIACGRINLNNKENYLTRQGVMINKINNSSAKLFSDDQLTAAEMVINSGIRLMIQRMIGTRLTRAQSNQMFVMTIQNHTLYLRLMLKV